MSGATCGKRLGLVRYGQLSAQLHSRWNVLLHGHACRPTFQSPGDRIEFLRNALRAARRERPFVIDAIVVLPDHLHAIITLPPGDSDFSGRWRRIKGHFSSALVDASAATQRRPNGDLALWQRRFWEHTIRDEGDFARHVDYVEEGLLPDDWAGDAGRDGQEFGEHK